MNKPESVLENVIQNFLGLLDTDRFLITAKKPDLELIYKENKNLSYRFCRLSPPHGENESKRNYRFCQRAEKA